MGDLFVYDFPPDLHRELKIKAAEEGKKLKAVIIETLRKGLQGSKKSKKGGDGK